MAESYFINELVIARERSALLTIENTTLTDSFDLYGLSLLQMPRTNMQAQCVESTFSLNKASAYSGGTLGTFASARSDAASLSGLITLAMRPVSVTTSSLYRNLQERENQAAMQARSAPMTFARTAASFGKLNNNGARNGDLLFSLATGAAVGIELAAGEGLAFVQSGGGQGVDSPMILQVEIEVGGSSYFASEILQGVPIPSTIKFVLFNEVGSGVTCKIRSIALTGATHNVTPGTWGSGEYQGGFGFSGVYQDPGFMFAFLDVNELTALSGNTVTPVPARSNATDLTGKLVVRKGSCLENLRVRTKGLGSAIQAIANEEIHTATTLSQGAAWSGNQAYRFMRGKSGDVSSTGMNQGKRLIKHGADGLLLKNCPIRIGPGQTFAMLVAGQDSVEKNIHAEITYVPSVAVYPAVGDVDSGVTYGPNSTDYTGTLEQPAITDVKTGVSYGAGGTEFTGTYSAGGGGGGVSRGRITNA